MGERGTSPILLPLNLFRQVVFFLNAESRGSPRRRAGSGRALHVAAKRFLNKIVAIGDIPRAHFGRRPEASGGAGGHGAANSGSTAF